MVAEYSSFIDNVGILCINHLYMETKDSTKQLTMKISIDMKMGDNDNFGVH